MLVEFFFCLRKYGLPVSLRELLDLLGALEQAVVMGDVQAFYALARAVMVKDESHYDAYDRAFADYFQGVESLELLPESLPEDWLNHPLMRQFSEEEKRQIEAMGGLEALMKTLKERLEEQQKRHQGGSKWIGTGGTSPFGAYGYNPLGVRIGQQGNNQFSAAKVWDKRTFKNLAKDVELGTRNIKLALRKLRQFARTGSSEELDLPQTIASTARNAGYLDVHYRPERHNAVKVLLFFDVGGSMDAHIRQCEELFSAAHTEFKHLKYFYFHNCVYEQVWRDARRRDGEDGMALMDVIHTYSSDYKLIFVGDATMGPYEITYPGGSVEHWNSEPGALWMERLMQHFPRAIWLNPQPREYWQYYPSIQLMDELVKGRMFPLTLGGLEQGIQSLLKAVAPQTSS